MRFNIRRPRIVRTAQPLTAPRRGDRASLQLALGYAIERAIGAGELRDYAHAAELLGVTRARVSQLIAMLGLAPAIQARLLDGENIHERSLRAATRHWDWIEQVAALKDKVR